MVFPSGKSFSIMKRKRVCSSLYWALLIIPSMLTSSTKPFALNQPQKILSGCLGACSMCPDQSDSLLLRLITFDLYIFFENITLFQSAAFYPTYFLSQQIRSVFIEIVISCLRFYFLANLPTLINLCRMIKKETFTPAEKKFFGMSLLVCFWSLTHCFW